MYIYYKAYSVYIFLKKPRGNCPGRFNKEKAGNISAQKVKSSREWETYETQMSTNPCGK